MLRNSFSPGYFRMLAMAGVFGPVLALAAAMLLCPAAVSAAAPEFQRIPGVSLEPAVEGAGFKGVEDLTAFFDEIMAKETAKVAGAAVAVVKDGQLIFAKGYGYADLDRKIPVDPATTLFRIGSISKTFTATAAMQLAEQGKLDINADVNRYLTQFQIPQTFPQPITVKNLMTHTSGMENIMSARHWARRPEETLPLADHLKRHQPARLAPPVTDFAAARVGAYCNWCVALEGLIVANVSGMSFDEYQEQHIFQPLGMNRSSSREPLPPELAASMSTGYSWKDGRFQPQDFEYIHAIGPAGNISSTATDMAQYMLAHLQKGAIGERRILSEDSTAAMHARQVSLSPYVTGAGFAFSETWINGRRLTGHSGGTLYFSSRLLLLPEENLGVFVTYNTTGSGGEGPEGVIRALIDRYYPAGALPKITPPADFAQRAGPYLGAYRPYAIPHSTIEMLPALLGGLSYGVSAENTLTMGGGHWVEVKPGVFRNRDSDDMMAFGEDAEGRLHTLLHPYGTAYRLRWYETPGFHQIVLGFGLLCFLIAIATALWNWKKDRAAPDAARRARRLAALLGIVHIVFIGLIAKVFFMNDVPLTYGFPPLIYLALTLPLLAIPLTAALLYFAYRAWREGFWSGLGRVQYSVTAVAGVAFLWSLNFWNLIGYNLG